MLNSLIILLSIIAAIFGVWFDFSKKENKKWGVILSIIIIASGIVTFIESNRKAVEEQDKDKIELERYKSLISNLNDQLIQINNLDTSITTRLAGQIYTLSKLDIQLQKNNEKNSLIASELNNASKNLSDHLVNFKEFENKINNEVFEVWVKINSNKNYRSEDFHSSFLNQYLDNIQDSIYYKSFTRNLYQNRLDNDSKLLSYIRNYDFKEIDWTYQPGHRQGILNLKDFDKASIKYWKNRYNKVGIMEEISITLIKSFPVEHFITNLDKTYLTFEDFISTSIMIIPENSEYFSTINNVSIYLIGQEKMKILEYMKDYNDNYIQRINVLQDWSQPNVLEMNISKEFYSRVQFTKKANILALIE